MSEAPKNDSGQLPATLADIGAMCDARNRAIAGWVEARRAFLETASTMMAICPGAMLPLAQPDYRASGIELHNAFLRKDDGTEFAKLYTLEVDRRCWSHLLDITGAASLMDRQAKEEWRESLKNPAPFTVENCKATFGHLWGSRRDLFLRGIANTFSRLDRRFRSHDGFKIGARVIIDNALETAGWSTPHWRDYDRRDTFADVERLLYELDGKAAPDPVDSIQNRVTELRICNLPEVLHTDYFRVRVFKNGNLHIWFERDDLLKQVNLLLAEFYGEVIGDGFNTTEADDAPEYHLAPAKKFGAFNTSPEIAQLMVKRYGQIREGQRVLEPSAGTGELAKVARDLGADVCCIEIQPGLAHELHVVHGFAKVMQGDFLRVAPRQLGGFDVVIMNPPFDRGRDCDHVRHAWQFVKPGGKLLAIMSARAEYGEDKRHKALHKIVDEAAPIYGQRKWIDLPPGSFAHAGTQVNTVILAIRKPS